jgi:hypothetical protein
MSVIVQNAMLGAKDVRRSDNSRVMTFYCIHSPSSTFFVNLKTKKFASAFQLKITIFGTRFQMCMYLCAFQAIYMGSW